MHPNRRRALWRGDGIERKHLVEGLLIGNESGFYQVFSGSLEGLDIHGKTAHEGGLRVVAQALVICHGYKEEVEGGGRMSARFDAALTDQAVIHPAELLRDLSDAVWTNGVLLDHGLFLSFELVD